MSIPYPPICGGGIHPFAEENIKEEKINRTDKSKYIGKAVSKRMRGKKLASEDIVQIMTLDAVMSNKAEIARKLDIPYSTVMQIIKEHKDDDEFVKLQTKKKDEFRERFAVEALDIIYLATERLRATLQDPEAKIPARDLSVITGTMCDKLAQVQGDPTQRIEISGGISTDKLADLAGYKRADKDG